jgi:hypothetical protein
VLGREVKARFYKAVFKGFEKHLTAFFSIFAFHLAPAYKPCNDNEKGGARNFAAHKKRAS